MDRIYLNRGDEDAAHEATYKSRCGRKKHDRHGAEPFPHEQFALAEHGFSLGGVLGQNGRCHVGFAAASTSQVNIEGNAAF